MSVAIVHVGCVDEFPNITDKRNAYKELAQVVASLCDEIF